MDTSAEIDSNANPTLNRRLTEAYEVNSPFRVEDFSYSNDALTDVIFNQLEQTSFDGITVCEGI